MGNVIQNCFGGANNASYNFLIEKKFSVDLLRDPNSLLVDLRDWDEYKGRHFRTAVNLAVNKIKSTEKKIDISQIFKESGIRDFLEFFITNAKQDSNSDSFYSPQVIFYTNNEPSKDHSIIQVLYDHREFLRGMSVNCFLLSDGFLKLSNEMTGIEYEEYFTNTQNYRLKTKNLYINDGNVTEIIDNFLLIGSHDNASDTGLIKGFSIKCIVNLSEKDLDYPPKNIEIKSFPINAFHDSNFLPSLPPIFEFLENAMIKKEKILLFCENGIHVAAAVGLAFLMKTKKWNLLQSFTYLHDLQPCIRPSIGFIRHLLEMESVLFPSYILPSLSIKSYILFYNQLEDLESNLQFITSFNFNIDDDIDDNKIPIEDLSPEFDLQNIHHDVKVDSENIAHEQTELNYQKVDDLHGDHDANNEL